MDFLTALKKQNNITQTDNGDFAYKSTMNANVDFFSKIDKYATPEELLKAFKAAYTEDKALAMLNLVYLRDIVDGKGVKEANIVLDWVIQNHPQALPLLAEIAINTTIGRADDLHFILNKGYDGVLQSKYADLLKNYFNNPLTHGYFYKWLPTKGSKTNTTRTQRANLLAKYWGLTPSQYRKKVVGKRKPLDLPETRVCFENFTGIDYAKIPSLAMLRYYNQFKEKDGENFQAYLESVKRGDKKINVKTLEPPQLLATKDYESDYVNAAWDAFDLEPSDKNVLVVADVSGSMYQGMGTIAPIHVSVAAALLTSSKLKGIFKNHFITFSESPELWEVKGDTLAEKVNFIFQAGWGYNTDIDRVFELILQGYQATNEKDSLIDRLVIVSDMQFDEAIDEDRSAFERAKNKFQQAGYKFPEVIFWNVNATNFQVDNAFVEDVALISGSTMGIFKQVLHEKISTPFEFMIETFAKAYHDNAAVARLLLYFNGSLKKITQSVDSI